jgi:hypothetical protein
MSNWICSQIGAREHYAVPRSLSRAGRLDSLYTDFWAGPILRHVKVSKLRPLATRCHSDLFTARVISWNIQAIRWTVDLRKREKRGGVTDKYRGWVEVGREFARQVASSLKRRSLENVIFFGYDTGSLETLEMLSDKGVPTLLSQMDPGRTEALLVAEEERLWPGWSTSSIAIPEEHFRRREQEWAQASRILVNSEFSRQALVQQNVPRDKIVVVPLCYEPDTGLRARPPIGGTGPLRVLFLGQVILRKGIQYLIEAARRMQDQPVHFDVVGPIGISEEAVRSAPGNMTFHGRASRDQIGEWYRRSHIFVLPTLSDGFAVTQLEAMAHGLPVIATSRCGDVVSDGIDGFVVSPRQPALLAEIIGRYIRDPDLVLFHHLAALRKSRMFGFDRLSSQLLALEVELAHIESR